MVNFGLIGASGYIAPRHIQAIHEVGSKLVTAYDPNQSVGILDKYSRDVAYYKTYEEYYYNIVTNLKDQLDYTSICSPNYLHKSHIALSLGLGSDVICEKPLVTDAKDLDFLSSLSRELGRNIYTVLQLREHQAIINLKDKVTKNDSDEIYNIDLCYITSRGPWYYQTWKANDNLSGDLCFNIGIHFFDMLTWIFGNYVSSEIHIRNHDVVAGYLQLEQAKVRWLLSINERYLPKKSTDQNQSTYRSILFNDYEIEFSSGFKDLHTKVYRQILNGEGYTIHDAEPAIRLLDTMRKKIPTGINANAHPLLHSL